MPGGRYSHRRINHEYRGQDHRRDRRRPALPAFVRPNRPRECAVQGATMIVKVGVQGRVILDRWAVHLAAKRSHFHVHPGSHLWMCARAGRRRGIKHGISQHA